MEPERGYYWRVRAESVCGPGAFSAVSRLTTNRAYCRTPNLAIPDNDETGVSDSMPLTAGGTISDLDVTVRINHTYVSELSARLTRTPGGQAIELVSSVVCPGGGGDGSARGASDAADAAL